MEWLYRNWKKFGKNFEEGGKLNWLSSFYDAFDTFLFTPQTTAKRLGTHIHDGSDSKRTMIIVVLALVPALLFGMFNVGYQHLLATGQLAAGMTAALWWKAFGFGFLAVLPYIIVSYVVGLGIEFTVAQIKHEEVAEGFLVTGFIIPLIVPINTPLWQVAIATAFAVIFAKEVFGGTGYNIFNVALITRAFLFFAYPSHMTGDEPFVRTSGTWGWDGGHALVDGFSGATPLTQMSTGSAVELDFWDLFNGLIPGSVGETCCWAILLGACLLLATGVASWKTMLSVFVGGGLTAWLFNMFGSEANLAAQYPWYMHLVSGGFAFGAVFMATDPVTSARTECGKYIYGFLIGLVAVLVRVLNPGYPEGMMLAILLMNAVAPLIDWCVVQANINRRAKRVANTLPLLLLLLGVNWGLNSCSEKNEVAKYNSQIKQTQSLRISQNTNEHLPFPDMYACLEEPTQNLLSDIAERYYEVAPHFESEQDIINYLEYEFSNIQELIDENYEGLNFDYSNLSIDDFSENFYYAIGSINQSVVCSYSVENLSSSFTFISQYIEESLSDFPEQQSLCYFYMASMFYSYSIITETIAPDFPEMQTSFNSATFACAIATGGIAAIHGAAVGALVGGPAGAFIGGMWSVIEAAVWSEVVCAGVYQLEDITENSPDELLIYHHYINLNGEEIENFPTQLYLSREEELFINEELLNVDHPLNWCFPQYTLGSGISGLYCSEYLKLQSSVIAQYYLNNIMFY